MRLGYPCINRSLPCRGSSRFILKSYSAARLQETVAGNIDCVGQMLEWNRIHGLHYFRLSSDLVPFASHPVCTFNWQKRFAPELAALGAFIRREGMRLAMHPDQFVLLNAQDPDIVRRSVAELRYHAEVLDLLGLPASAKMQVHVGGVYGDKPRSLARFVREHGKLDRAVARRLVIENDERLYDVQDCLQVSAATGAPVLFDVFHHACLNRGESIAAALQAVKQTWRQRDGLPLVDYSEQAPGGRFGAHAETMTDAAFRAFLRASRPHDCDVMLEIKDKEKSALRALRLAARDPRLSRCRRPAATGGGRR